MRGLGDPLHYRSQRPSGVTVGNDSGIYNGTFFDLGPDGGDAGGRVVAAATPEGVVRLATHTGKALEAVLAR